MSISERKSEVAERDKEFGFHVMSFLSPKELKIELRI